MDYSESTKVVFQRIGKLDPYNVSKIISYLLLKDHGELEMIRLAFGPDNLIQSLIDKVKKEVDSSSPKSSVVSPNNPRSSTVFSNLPTNFTPFTPSLHSVRSSAPFPHENCQWIVPSDQPLMEDFHYIPVTFSEPEYVIQNQPQIVFVDQYCPFIVTCQECPESTVHICQSFNEGYCKYGGNCRFLHILRMDNGGFMILNPPKMEEDRVLSHASLKKLEIELIGLLKTRRGVPVSISSLPIFYYDKYGSVLQVNGYIMDIPGQGEVRFTLTQVVAHMMTKSIRLIDRSHGRQSILLVEDISRLIEEQSDNKLRSCQVYLTFPQHSMFSEDDVYTYFNIFGAVQEVRLPNQEKRMFGFVTFVYPETVVLVLTKTNPHFICGAKVLVKPYRIKPMLFDRKTEEKVEHPIHLPDPEFRPPPTPKEGEITITMKKLIQQSVELDEKKHTLIEQTSNNVCSPMEGR